MALAAGYSSIRCGPLTMHTQTAIHVAEKIMKVCVQCIKVLNLRKCFHLSHFVPRYKKIPSQIS